MVCGLSHHYCHDHLDCNFLMVYTNVQIEVSMLWVPPIYSLFDCFSEWLENKRIITVSPAEILAGVMRNKPSVMVVSMNKSGSGSDDRVWRFSFRQGSKDGPVWHRATIHSSTAHPLPVIFSILVYSISKAGIIREPYRVLSRHGAVCKAFLMRHHGVHK